jgi:hypothetical protein
MFRRFVGKQILKRVSGGKIQKPGRIQALLRMPVLLRLGYALMRDSRVPLWQRASVIGLLVLIFSPIDVVGNIPVLGEFWDFSLGVVVLEAFIQWAPPGVVNEHITRLGLSKKVPLRPV